LFRSPALVITRLKRRNRLVDVWLNRCIYRSPQTPVLLGREFCDPLHFQKFFSTCQVIFGKNPAYSISQRRGRGQKLTNLRRQSVNYCLGTRSYVCDPGIDKNVANQRANLAQKFCPQDEIVNL
jgi:hypothetical protein